MTVESHVQLVTKSQ